MARLHYKKDGSLDMRYSSSKNHVMKGGANRRNKRKPHKKPRKKSKKKKKIRGGAAGPPPPPDERLYAHFYARPEIVEMLFDHHRAKTQPGTDQFKDLNTSEKHIYDQSEYKLTKKGSLDTTAYGFLV